MSAEDARAVYHHLLSYNLSVTKFDQAVLHHAALQALTPVAAPPTYRDIGLVEDEMSWLTSTVMIASDGMVLPDKIAKSIGLSGDPKPFNGRLSVAVNDSIPHRIARPYENHIARLFEEFFEVNRVKIKGQRALVHVGASRL